MIRLTIAHAKSRLSNEANIDDAKVALGIMMYALYHESFHTSATPTSNLLSTNPLQLLDDHQYAYDKSSSSSINNEMMMMMMMIVLK